jgi:hypothetical protein
MFSSRNSKKLVLRRAGQDGPENWVAQIRSSGNYLNPSITPELFAKVPVSTWEVTMRFVPFVPSEGSPLFILQQEKLVQPTLEHALCFAATEPRWQESVLFPHEPIYLPHLLHWAGLITAVVNHCGSQLVCLPPAAFEFENGLYVAGVESN